MLASAGPLGCPGDVAEEGTVAWLRAERRSVGRLAAELSGAGLASGLLAGVAMALVWTLASAIGGGGFWTPLRAMAATVRGAGALEGGAGAALGGFGLHLAISAVLGLAFTLLLPRRAGTPVAALAGVVFAGAIWAAATFLALPLFNATLHRRVDALPVPWVLAHVAFGLALGAVPAIRDRFAPLPRPRWFVRETERRHRKVGRIAALEVVAGLVALRIALPWLVEAAIDRQLARNPGYAGGVDDVDLALWRGAARIEGVTLLKREAEHRVPFLAVERIEAGVDWRALFQGHVVARVDVFRPEVNFIAGPPAVAQTGAEVDWTAQLRELMPVKIDHLAIADGVVHLRDAFRDPPIEVYVQDLDVEAANLTNSLEVAESLFATVVVSATTMSHGTSRVHAVVDPYASPPTFDLDLTVQGLRLRELNPFLERYVHVDVEAGTFALYAEVASRDGRFRGYAKPMVDGLDVVRLKKELAEGDSPGRIGWEAIAGLVSELLENQPRERIAARVPVEGRFDDPKIGVWPAIGTVLRNAFVQALVGGVEGRIDLGDVPSPAELRDGKGGKDGKGEEGAKDGKGDSRG